MAEFQQVSDLGTVEEVMHLVGVLTEESYRMERTFRVAMSQERERDRGWPSAERERVFRMAEMQLEDMVADYRRVVGLLYERAEEIERSGAVNVGALDRGYSNYDSRVTSPHWRDVVILPDEAGAAASG